MNLKGVSAIECCEIILRVYEGASISSENMKEKIILRGGNNYKVSNLERRMRDSGKIRSVKVKGKNYVKYRYVNDESQEY